MFVIAQIIANMVGIWLANFLVPGFIFSGTIKSLALMAVFLTAINLLIKPIIKFILSPFIILTFGLFTILINAAILYAVDYFFDELTITGFWPLLWGTIIIAIINFIFTRKRHLKSKPQQPPQTAPAQ